MEVGLSRSEERNCHVDSFRCFQLVTAIKSACVCFRKVVDCNQFSVAPGSPYNIYNDT